MSRWTNIVSDDIKAAGYGAIVDRANTLATGSVDPVPEAIANATARVRRSVAAGNALDTDITKVPGSLKGVVVRMALFALMERIGLPLSEDQRKSRDLDSSDLNRLADHKIRVEEPDTADASLVPQNRGSWNSENKIIGRMHPVPAPGRQFPSSGYANPDAVPDSQ